MKKILTFIFGLFISLNVFGEDIMTPVDTTFNLNEVTVTSLYRNNVNVGYLIPQKVLVQSNYGQEPSNLFIQLPNIYAMNDNGTEFGYGYFRIRGLDQTRINVTLDGMPWNEAEDYGTYFANSPDLLSSMHSIKIERGTSSTNNGTASSGGSINLESVDLLKDTVSYATIGGGFFGTYRGNVVYNSGLLKKSAFHIKANIQHTNGFKDYGFNNSQAFTLKYGYWFNQNHSIDILSLNGHHENGQGWLGNTKEELAINKNANGNVEDDKDNWFQTVNKIQYKGKIHKNIFLTSSIYLQYQKGWYNMDLDNYMIRMVDPTWEKTNILYSYGLEHYLYGGNVVAKLYLKDWKLTAGTNYYRYQRNHYMNDRVSSHFKNVDPSEYYDNTGYKNDVNGFISANYTYKKFNISGNIQYRYVDFSYDDHLDSHNNLTIYSRGTNWHFINYGVNAEYNIKNNSKLYVRFAAVSREPTRTDMFGGNETYLGYGLTTNKAERSYDIEAGYEISSNKIKANLNAYYMKFKNERVLNGEYGLNGLPLHDTADNSYRMGLEGSVDWNFFDSFHYIFNSSISRNKINSKNFDNKNHILTPSITMNNEINYTKSNWKVGIFSHYHSKMYIDQENNYEVPNFLVFNVFGNYRYKNFEIGAKINNIFNKTNYYNAAIGATDILWFRNAGISVFGELKYYF